MLKQIMIPVAALAITATSASAFTGGAWLESLNLTDEQKSALEEAQTIRQEANEEAKQVLEDAGLDDEAMKEIHDAMREERDASRQAMDDAIEANDYNAFLEAVKDMPFADAVTSEEDFAKFKEAHELMKSGDRDAAKEIMEDLGIEGMRGLGGGKGPHGGPGEASEDAPTDE